VFVKVRVLLLLAVLALLAGGSIVAERDNQKKVESADPAVPTYLSDLRWEEATTGWVALADDNLPKLNTSFLNGTISVGGRGYDKGIGTYPLSEITYDLAGKYDLFEAEVGVDDVGTAGSGSVIFKIFLDDAMAYDSGVVRSGSGAQQVELPVTGVGKMKLVVEDDGDGTSFDYADWAGARLFSAGKQAGRPPSILKANLDFQREVRSRERDQDWYTIRQRSEQESTAILSSFRGTEPSSEAEATFDVDRRLIVLANDKVAITLGYGGERHGLLDILDLETQTLVAFDTTPVLTTSDASTIALSRNTKTDGGGYSFRRVEDPVLGSGTEVEADFLLQTDHGAITPRITLYDGSSYLTYQLELRGVEAEVPVRSFSFFSPDELGRFVLGEDSGYVTSYSLMRRADVRDDSILRKELVGLGEPVVLYDRSRKRGVVMAVIDEVDDPSQLAVRMDAGRVSAQVGFDHALPKDVRATSLLLSPRLFIQPGPATSPEEATSGFRKVMAGLYPPPQIPEWVKYQWGTWYAFGMSYNEATVKAQIDYISRNLADLGEWHILLDAGWYVAEGRPGSSWENVDEEKFPNGLRSVVDYAHSKGVRVVLYFSAPYLDDRDREGNWLGLRGFIDEHPDWVIPLQTDSSGASYVYDFTNPALVEYMRKLIASFFLQYDVDGIKIDGLGQAEGEQLQQQDRDTFGDVNKIRMFTMDIYRLVWQEAIKAKKDVYVEGGWAIPSYANRFAHTFRYGDEFPAIENRYPAPGLLEHIDYAALQKRVVGQRPNMGMIWGGPESQQMIRLWFEAALAMGTQMTISTDLTRLTPRDLSSLRSVLMHYNAFQDETRFAGMPLADSFATTTGDITYLGAVNRESETKLVTFKLSDYGLDENADYLLYDVSSGGYSKVRGSFQASLSDPSFQLYLLRATPGVVWTSSTVEAVSGPNSLKVTVRGPRSIAGIAQIYVPSLSSVLLDGKELQRSPNPSAGGSYLYDPATGILRLRYRHDQVHSIEIGY
jgi:hypothetical protein